MVDEQIQVEVQVREPRGRRRLVAELFQLFVLRTSARTAANLACTRSKIAEPVGGIQVVAPSRHAVFSRKQNEEANK